MIQNSYKRIINFLSTQEFTLYKYRLLLEEAMDKNLLEATAQEFKSKIDILPIYLETDLTRLIRDLVWGVSIAPDNSSTAYELLVQLCNRIVREFENITFELEADTLATIFIVADNRRDFIEKLTDAQKTSMIKYLDSVFTEGHSACGLSFFNDVVADIGMDEMSKKYGHNTSDPIHIKLLSILQGLDIKNDLITLTNAYVADGFENEKLFLAKKFSYKTDNGITVTEAGYIFDHILLDYLEFARKMENRQTISLPCEEYGELIWSVDSDINNFSMVIGNPAKNLNTENVLFILEQTLFAFKKFYRTNDQINIVLDRFVEDFRKDMSTDNWFKGASLKSVKIFLDKNPAFKMFCENIETEYKNRLVLNEDEIGYRSLIYRYIDLKIDDWGFATEATAQELREKEEELEDRERELEERERRLRSKSRARPNYDDEEDADEDQNTDDDETSEKDRNDHDYDIEAKQSNKGYHKSSKIISSGTRKIYRGFHKFKENEQRVDSQLDKMITDAKTAFAGGDKTEAILSGKRWTPLGLLKQVLKTAAVFSFGKIPGLIYIVTSFALDKKRTEKQRREILGELDTEIKMIEEKIDDARGDGNRQAKYALMRTKGELERARDKIRYNLNASKFDLKSARDVIAGKRSYDSRTSDTVAKARY